MAPAGGSSKQTGHLGARRRGVDRPPLANVAVAGMAGQSSYRWLPMVTTPLSRASR